MEEPRIAPLHLPLTIFLDILQYEHPCKDAHKCDHASMSLSLSLSYMLLIMGVLFIYVVCVAFLYLE